jgi:hypothetical protein
LLTHHIVSCSFKHSTWIGWSSQALLNIIIGSQEIEAKCRNEQDGPASSLDMKAKDRLA